MVAGRKFWKILPALTYNTGVYYFVSVLVSWPNGYTDCTVFKRHFCEHAFESRYRQIRGITQPLIKTPQKGRWGTSFVDLHEGYLGKFF
jgi:hypothetical protein